MRLIELVSIGANATNATRNNAEDTELTETEFARINLAAAKGERASVTWPSSVLCKTLKWTRLKTMRSASLRTQPGQDVANVV
jgi:hypothetical protein